MCVFVCVCSQHQSRNQGRVCVPGTHHHVHEQQRVANAAVGFVANGTRPQDPLRARHVHGGQSGDAAHRLARRRLGDAGTGWSDAKIAADLHPDHNRQTLRQLRDSIRVFPSGNCVVHHMFGAQVVDTVKEQYQDAFVTAHLEVPGEMFEIAMQKSLTDQGVVGSTSDILKFISRKVQEAASAGASERLKFILGTEAGMVTSIVSSVQSILAETGNNAVEAEIVFPVASEAVMATGDEEGMALVPGVAGGEGCSTAGGCATCPFMKMNDLDALMDVLELVGSKNKGELQKHLPPDRLRGKSIDGRPAIDFGTEPIAYMRAFNQHKKLPDELVQKVMRTAQR